jgi:hypothetical protein
MNHPEKILRTLDAHLTRPTRLILYGRAALALGFGNSPPSFQATLDVDAILPEVEMTMIDDDDQFWDAIGKTNDQLESSGLYITHLFVDTQIIISPNWLTNITPIKLSGLYHLKLFRPSTLDLILTKMMRIDPQDRTDINFLISRSELLQVEVETTLAAARIPAIPEIQEAFEQNSLWLLSKFR